MTSAAEPISDDMFECYWEDLATLPKPPHRTYSAWEVDLKNAYGDAKQTRARVRELEAERDRLVQALAEVDDLRRQVEAARRTAEGWLCGPHFDDKPYGNQCGEQRCTNARLVLTALAPQPAPTDGDA